jgi:hypothetical protein
VWENGFAFTAWGWGGGIVVSSSGGAEVSGNTVAWNSDGIIVLSQSRSGAPNATNNKVHDNVVAIAPQPGDGSDKMAVAWLQDWSGILFNAGTGNTGSNNRYWLSVGEPQWARFGWNGPISTLASFNATPGGTGGVYLSAAALATVLADAGVPGIAKPHLDPARTVPRVGAHRLVARHESGRGLPLRRRPRMPCLLHASQSPVDAASPVGDHASRHAQRR